MTKGRKTTFEVRMEIVRYCLDNGRNYQRTAEVFAVSYQQVYGWTKKYDADGVHRLEDRRGRTKQEEELTKRGEARTSHSTDRAGERAPSCREPVPKKVGRDREERLISQIRLQLRYMAIKEMSTTDTFPVVLLCEIAQVSRAAYYKWLKRTVSARE